jgi:general secretion pathway protein N
MRRPRGRLVAIGAAALAGALAMVLAQAPASLLASALGRWGDGAVELGDATGTVWNGQADLILSGGDRGGTDAGPRVRLPGRLAWRIRPGQLLLGTLDLRLEDAAILDAPVLLRMDRSGGADLDANVLRLPASVLVGLGAPWNTIRPGGDLRLEWDTVHLRAGTLRGQLRGEWTGASSTLSPVVPFGHYRLLANGIFDGATLQLETVSGPMEMTGNGTIAGGMRLQFRGRARVQSGTDPAIATQLAGLISLLGRNDGDGAILNFGT